MSDTPSHPEPPSGPTGPRPDFARKPVLRGERALLRPVTEDDVPAMIEVLSDPEVTRLTGSHLDFSERQLRHWYATRAEQDDRLDLAVVDAATGACVGEAVLNEWDPENSGCNFRIAVGPAGRGRGLGTEATRLVVGYGFDVLGLHRISLEVYAFNPRALRTYEKVGFTAEGTLREALRWEGAWVDATVMSILDREWAAHRGRPGRGAEPVPDAPHSPDGDAAGVRGRAI